MKPFKNESDPYPKNSQGLQKIKKQAQSGFNILANFKQTIADFSGSFSLRLPNYSFDKQYFSKEKLNSFLPHFGIAILTILVIAGSLIGRQDRVADYQALQASILAPEEVKQIALSIDKYTPQIKESKSDFINSLQPKEEPLTTVRGYVNSPEIVLANFKKTSNGPKSRDKLIDKYLVKDGDTVSSIASNFGVNVSTLRWANKLSNLDYIKPGQKLIIPEKNGVWHTIEKGETVSSLVSEYNGNLKQTLLFNGLGKGDKVKEHQKLLVVGGEKATSDPTPSSSTVASAGTSSYRQPTSRSANGSSYNRFPYGWCTWYAASRRNVPWSGNAGAWLANARAMGYSTGHSPAVGAIIVTNESWVGHVGIVEAVYGNMVKISEMNGIGGWGVVSTRSIPKYSGRIMGYIY